MNERPVSLRKKPQKSKVTKSKNISRACIVHFVSTSCISDIYPLTLITWSKIKSSIDYFNVHGSSQIIDDVRENVPQTPDFENHGFHRECYQRFTCIKRKPHVTDNEPTKKKRVPSGDKRLFPSNSCVICNKETRWLNHKGKRVRDKLVKCVTKDAEITLKEAAVIKKDNELLVKIYCEDLIAAEAHYHAECRKLYTVNINLKTEAEKNIESEKTCSENKLLNEAHNEAFLNLTSYIENEIIKKHCIVRMSYLKQLYLQFIKEHHPLFYNENYSTQKLKNKITKHFSSRVSFAQTNRTSSELVFSEEIPTESVVSFAYDKAASDKRILESAADILRRSILECSKSNVSDTWPPSQEYLDSTPWPDELSIFLQKLLISKKTTIFSQKIQRKINSLAQDICFCVSKGSWQLPKHLMLGMSIHHLTGSAELITLLNRMGHCVSYSKILELETATADQIILSDKVLPYSVLQSSNTFTHFCWDNFDLLEETPTGSGTTHSVHGIVLQEQGESTTGVTVVKPVVPKSKKRSLVYVQPELPTCSITKREPEINVNFSTFDQDINRHDLSTFLWFLHRVLTKHDRPVPNWFGWLYITSSKCPIKPTAVEYLHPIHSPATENRTIQELLKRSQKATQELGQTNTVITLDLAMAKKAFAVIYDSPDLYKDVFIRLGTFHTISAYFHALGKMLDGSGFEEVLLESSLCANGSLQGVMTGKQYNRSLRVHSIMAEAIESLAWEQFSLKVYTQEQLKGLDKDLRSKDLSQNAVDVDSYATVESIHVLMADFNNEIQKYRSGCYGPTPQYWISYVDKVWLVLRLLRSLKDNDFCMYKACLKQMIPMFFAFDQPNYARYLTLYVTNLESVDATHPEASKYMKECALSVKRTIYPTSGTPVDQTIEQTINKHAKSAGGLIGFSRNIQAYDRWCLTRHERTKYFVSTFESVGMLDGGHNPKKETRQNEMIRNANAIAKVVTTIKTFLNPFAMCTDDPLTCISSGKPATKEIANDILNVQTIGSAAHKDFVENRFNLKTVSFHAAIKRKKLLTFGELKKSVTVKGKNKDFKVVAQRNICAQILMLSQQYEIDIEKLFTYPLGPIPWAMATGDGLPVKTDKSALMHKIEYRLSTRSQDLATLQNDSIYIIDGNVLIHTVTAVPDTFGQLAKKIFLMLPQVSQIHFVTDTYKDDSIKSTERIRRGIAEKLIIHGPATKVPKNFQKFLCAEENKKQLIELLFNEWSKDVYAPLLKDKELFFVCENQCTLITSNDISIDNTQIVELNSSQEEADTRIFLHLSYIDSHYPNRNVTVRSTDTDVFILFLHFHCRFKSCNQLLFDTGVGDHRRVIDIRTASQSFSEHFLEALPGLHSFTGCDTTSAFIRQGKIKPLRILEQNDKFLSVFKDLGQNEDVLESTMKGLEKFTCLLYGNAGAHDINTVRFLKATERFCSKQSLISSRINADLSLLPPCLNTLQLHIKRSNYQALIWKRSTEAYPLIPPPSHHGWKNCNGQICIDWGDEMFPKEIQDILEDLPVATDDYEDADSDICLDEPNIFSDDESDTE